MNVTTKKTSILILVILILSLLLTLFRDLSWKSYLNTLFTFSLTILTLGLVMFVSRGGFFDVITITFRRMFTSTSKRSEFLNEDMNNMALPSEFFGSQITMIFLFSGLTLTVLTILIGFIV